MYIILCTYSTVDTIVDTSVVLVALLSKGGLLPQYESFNYLFKTLLQSKVILHSSPWGHYFIAFITLKHTQVPVLSLLYVCEH